jgi:xanthine dehydrogenase/oxidase
MCEQGLSGSSATEAQVQSVKVFQVKLRRVMPCCAVLRSRCTGYRPILDAFKVFAKSEAAAYTADAIAAAKGMAAATAADSASGSNGALKGSNGSNGMVCPSSGLPCDCGSSGSNGGGSFAAAPAGPNGSNGSCGVKVNEAAAAAAAADVKPSSEPIFPKELKGRPAAALKLEGRC